uniref:Uncharacterized protein n=1 Tax=Myotis myotis TaxID=51298 RepID=A0A7J7V3L3_MYOMY|nr:hypothetical protein mMyoMyo1_008468 [Myotis myotis]
MKNKSGKLYIRIPVLIRALVGRKVNCRQTYMKSYVNLLDIVSIFFSLMFILEARCTEIRAIGLPSPGCRHWFSSSTQDPGLWSSHSGEAKPLQSSVFSFQSSLLHSGRSLLSSLCACVCKLTAIFVGLICLVALIGWWA